MNLNNKLKGSLEKYSNICSGGSSGGGELRESLVGCGPKTLIDT